MPLSEGNKLINHGQ